MPDSDVSTTAARHSRLKLSHVAPLVRATMANDHVQYPEPAAAGQAVGHEVQAPPLVRPLRDGHRRSGAQGALSATTFAHGEAFLLVDAIQRYRGLRGPTGATVPSNSSSPTSPRAAAEDAAADSRSVAVPTTDPSVGSAGQYPPIALAVVDTHADQSLPKCRPVAAGIPSVSWPNPRRDAAHRA